MIEPENITSLDIELAVAHYFNPRVNIIVPNISWGMNLHECDLLVLTKAGYAYEIEIKISKSDLIADRNKKHQHKSKRIRKLYFALPYYLIEKCKDHIPVEAGIISVIGHGCMSIIREAEIKSDYKFNEVEKLNLVRLGAMRIWPLKRIIRDSHKIKSIKKRIEYDMRQMNIFEEAGIEI